MRLSNPVDEENVPNAVPNGSGRKAKLSDDELMSIVLNMAQQDGALPTLGAIITAAGGCQRSRAVAARKSGRAAMAKGDLEAMVRIPPEIEVRYRTLLADWLSLARQQLLPVLNAVAEEADNQVASAELSAQDARDRLEQVEQRHSQVSLDLESAIARIHALLEANAELTRSEVHWKALATERGEVIERLTVWPEPEGPKPK